MFLVTLTLSLVHSTTTQTTDSVTSCGIVYYIETLLEQITQASHIYELQCAASLRSYFNTQIRQYLTSIRRFVKVFNTQIRQGLRYADSLRSAIRKFVKVLLQYADSLRSSIRKFVKVLLQYVDSFLVLLQYGDS